MRFNLAARRRKTVLAPSLCNTTTYSFDWVAHYWYESRQPDEQIMNKQGVPTDGIANRDIYPAQELVALYPEFESLINNPLIASAFDRHEMAATSWKRRYTRLGGTALIAILFVMVLSDYRLTLEQHYGQSKALIAVSAVAGMIGLGAELVLIFTKAKERWLVERFAAERLRCLKFQLFGLLSRNREATGLASEVETTTRRAIAHLDYELMGGRTALQEFSPAKLPLLHEANITLPDNAFIQRANALYNTLRLQVQLQHFDEQFKSYWELTRSPLTLGEISFAFGAFLALVGTINVSAGLLPTPTNFRLPDIAQAWLNFLTWFLFVVSSILAVHQRGSAHQANADRYDHYGREIRQIKETRSHVDLLTTVSDMERIALHELRDFCRDMQSSNYVF
jgi:hypothetical protein